MGPGGLRLLLLALVLAPGGDAVQAGGGQQAAEQRHREAPKLMRSEAEDALEQSSSGAHQAQAHARWGLSSEGDPAPAPAPPAPAPKADAPAGAAAAECAPCAEVKSLVGEKANPAIPDKNIEASTTWQNDPDHGYGQMWRARLDNDDTPWCAGSNDAHQWLKFRLAQKSVVTAIVTKGRANCCDQWVSKYDVIGDDKPQGSFKGNTDGKSEVKNQFEKPFVAEEVVVVPTEWSNHISMRVELLGCPCVKPTTTTTTTKPTTTTTAATKNSARPLDPGRSLSISASLLALSLAIAAPCAA